MDKKCLECTYCFPGRGCCICRAGNADPNNARCQNCKRNYCEEHISLAHNVTSVTPGVTPLEHNRVALLCDGCMGNMAALSRYVAVCRAVAEEPLYLPPRKSATLEHIYGINTEFVPLEDDLRNMIMTRTVEYNMKHVRRSVITSPDRITTPRDSPSKRKSESESPPAKKTPPQ